MYNRTRTNFCTSSTQFFSCVTVPQITNDYNYWILGMDLIDQFIVYYCPKLWCCQTWVPIMLHCWNILIISTHILHKEMCKRLVVKENDKGHKDFFLDLIDLVVRRSIIKHNTRQQNKFNLQLCLVLHFLETAIDFQTQNHHSHSIILYVIMAREEIAISFKQRTWQMRLLSIQDVHYD